MLDADGVEALGLFLDRLALIVQVAEGDLGRAFDLVEDLGHRQTAFLIGQCVFRGGQDLGVHIVLRGRLLALAGQVHDDHPLGHAHLHGGQADAGRVVHGFQHVIHQGAQLVSHAAFNRGRDLLEHRQVGGVVHGEDATDSHSGEVRAYSAAVKLRGVSVAASFDSERGVASICCSSSIGLPWWSTDRSSKRRAWVRTWLSSEPTNWL